VGSIPFTGKNIHVGFDDVVYEFRQCTDETEMELADFETGFFQEPKPQTTQERFDYFQKNDREWRRWINGHIDIILVGWSSEKYKLPEFTKMPSKLLSGKQKGEMLDWWRVNSAFADQDLKK
jgi:hypothetical protein